MAKKKSKGGRRPVEPSEKVILVGFYTKKRYVDRVGGMDRARDRPVYSQRNAPINGASKAGNDR